MHSRRFTETVLHRGRVFVVSAERGRGVHSASVFCGTVERRFSVETTRFGACTRVKAIEIYEGLEALERK